MANMREKKVEMPVQEPNIRNKNFDEVALGYTEEMAKEVGDAMKRANEALANKLKNEGLWYVYK